MPKYSFKNDYSEGAHPNILNRLLETNLLQESGYGEDSYSQEAISKIKQAILNETAEVHFVSGGTQTNRIVLESLLKPYESVIAAQTGHIAVHEAGAIEATGHKINTVNCPDGKLTVELIQKVLTEHSDEHLVKPKVVFVSQATEVGTIYQKSELTALSDFCHKNGLLLYLDGARLGSGLCNSQADLNLPELAKLVDAFYIGGTKNGALLGEAVVLVNPTLHGDFRRYLKQNGALLAKGRLLGIQFAELFSNNLFFELATHANLRAQELTNGIRELGYSFLTNSPSNQIFPIFPNEIIGKLLEKYDFYEWSNVSDTEKSIRLVTSWATPAEMVQEFLADLRSLV